MLSLRSSTSRTAIACALALTVPTLAGTPATAGTFSVPGATGSQTLSGTQTGTIAAGATLTGTVTWNNPATGTGVVLSNAGTLTSATASTRAIDTVAGVSGLFTLNNSSTGVISAGDDAFRINGTLANGTVTINNAGSITSATGQAFDFDKTNAATAAVTINNSGAITTSAAGSDAVRLGGGTISLTNSGTISTTSLGKRAIKFDGAANVDTLTSFTLVNLAGGVISGTDDSIKIAGNPTSTSSARIVIDNAGTIRSSVDGQGIDLGDLVSKNLTISIINRAGGLITAVNNDGIQGGMNTAISNYGQITSNYSTTSATDQNFSAIKFDGGTTGVTGSVHNYAGGVISGAYHGVKASGALDVINVINDAGATITGRNGSGVNSNGSGSLLNYGVVTGTFDPAAAFGDGDGVDFDNPATVTNYGTIRGLGSKGIKPGETTLSLSEGIAIGGGTIVNGSAGVTTALISGANNGILADNSNHGDAFAATSVTNYGTIQGLNGFGIQMVNAAGTFSNTIVNYGSITGTSYAVAMGNGNDLFVYEAGSSVTGAVMAQGGTDTFRLGEVAGTFNVGLLGNTSTYQGFEILNIQAGSAWTLTGSSTFAGTTTVTGASLTLNNASLGSSQVQVGGAGALLAGTGTIGGLAASAGATISPGLTAGSIGTLAVAGNASFASGTTYAVTVNSAGGADRLAVSDATALATGVAVNVQALTGPYADFSQRYTILTSGGGVSGTFGSVSSNMAFLTPVLSYDANDVYLALNRNDVSFASVATTPNGRAVANAVQASAPNTALYNALVTGTVASAQSAFQLLSGEAQASLGNTLFNQNQLMADTVDARLRQAAYAGAIGSTAALGFGGPTAYAKAPVTKAGPFTSAPAPAPVGPVWTGWAQAFGQWNSASGNGNASSIDSTVGGFLAGVDATANNVTLGFAAGYSWATSSVADTGSSLDSDAAQFALYAGTSFGALKVRAGANLAWNEVDSTRVVVAGALTERPAASYNGLTGGAFGEVGFALPVGPVAFEPYAALAWSTVQMDGFTETGAPVTGLTSGGLGFDTWYSTMGLRAASSFALGGLFATPHATLGWRHAYGDLTPAMAMTFLNTGTGFTVQGLPIAQDSAIIGAGIDLALGKGITVGVSYDGSFASDIQSNAVRGTASISF